MQKNIRKNSFKYSLETQRADTYSAYFPVGTVYGLMMSAAGYNFLWSAAASLFVYAGSLQMLMISFFRSDMSILTIAVTALLLNSRHMFYGLSFIEKFRSYGAWKWFLIYGMPDGELFAAVLLCPASRALRKSGCTYLQPDLSGYTG